MNRIVRIALAIAVGVGLTTSASAQGRHDEKPHGYDAKAAAERAKSASQDRYVILPSGPRAHDNPLRGRKIAVTPKKDEQKAPNSTSEGAERK